jgi:hypothetical protein
MGRALIGVYQGVESFEARGRHNPKGRTQMNGHWWRVIAVATMMSVSLAGLSWAAGGGVKSPSREYKGPPPSSSSTAHLWNVKVSNVKFLQQSNPSNGNNQSSNDLNVSDVWAQPFKVTVTVENSGTVQFSQTGKVTLNVTGGKKVGTYDHSFNKTLTLPITNIAAKKTGSVTFDLNPGAGDEGPYYFRADLTAPQ